MKGARRAHLVAEAALAAAVAAGSFALVAVVIIVVESDVAVAAAGAAWLVAVVAIARTWGPAYAVPAAIAALIAYDWYFFAPTHPRALPDAANLADLALYLATAVLVGLVAADAGRRADVSEVARSALAISDAASREELARLADEQAALRRVATLVARETPPDDVFATVAAEVGRLVDAEDMGIVRFDGDRAVVVGSWGEFAAAIPVGASRPLGGENVSSRVHDTGRCARIDDYSKGTGAVADYMNVLGIRSAVAAPIVVVGRLWGAMIASTRRPGPLPADTESRLAEFTDLVATAIANVQARTDLAASRARIVEATDEERRRVVRDLHDGAQQRLVQTVITLKLAQRALRDEDGAAPELVGEALACAKQATVELRELAHGILPAVLVRGGLGAGAEALAARMSLPVELDVPRERLPRAVEATAYFVVAEALTNVAKHARATSAAVVARIESGTLRVHVRDDGAGGACPDGSGLLGLADRLAVLDGALTVDSPAGGGTLVAATIPIAGGRP